MDLPPEMVAVLAAFAPLFSDRVWIKAPGPARTVGRPGNLEHSRLE
jgi:hypothetical protein